MDFHATNGRACPAVFRSRLASFVIGTFRRSGRPRTGCFHEQKATYSVEPLPYIARSIDARSSRNLDLAITRRHLLQGGAFAAIAPTVGMATGRLPSSASPCAAAASEPAWRHAVSLFGDVKYPEDFARFDYVNPDAPKGGVARQISIGTFDNFNIAVLGREGRDRDRRWADLRNR